MNGKAADLGKLLDPGSELPTYDPDWETRWDRANTLLDLVGRHDPRSTSELTRRLGEELREAAFAGFQFAHDLEEHLAVASAGPAERAALPLPRMLGSATVAEMVARHAAFRALCGRVEAYRAAEPFEEWDNGVFRLEPMEDAAREIRDREVPADWRSDRRTKARLIIERHEDVVHVCVLEDPRAEAPVTLAALEFLARALSDEFLQARRDRLRRKPRPRLMLHGILSPFGRSDAARLSEYEIVPDSFSDDLSLVETRVVRRATPLMVREMLGMDQELRLALRA
ncbi:hypothetical protein [Amaricoccus sp. W119]|uniref:hypothetical protein n=1 Tax=Amaricoccus sp. W119 TaxID=3391833 RepID=UPI0039A5867A